MHPQRLGGSADIATLLLQLETGTLISARMNPWAKTPLSDTEIDRLMVLYQFRPEYSFFCLLTLKQDVASAGERIKRLLEASLLHEQMEDEE